MNFGAEPKKLAFLGGVLLLAAYTVYTNVLSEPEIPASARQAKAKGTPGRPQVQGLPQAPTAADRQAEERAALRKQSFAGRQSVGEYHASVKYPRPEDRPDPMKVDPTLHLEVLAKLQKVILEGGNRSLFEFGSAPPPKRSDADIKMDVAKKAAEAAKAKELASAAPPPKTPDAKPPAPPIPLKFYGFTTPKSGGIRRAFFLEGEDIHVAAEGDTIKRRYKIVKVGITSAIVEDTEYKNQQTLPLEEPPVTG